MNSSTRSENSTFLRIPRRKRRFLEKSYYSLGKTDNFPISPRFLPIFGLPWETSTLKNYHPEDSEHSGSGRISFDEAAGTSRGGAGATKGGPEAPPRGREPIWPRPRASVPNGNRACPLSSVALVDPTNAPVLPAQSGGQLVAGIFTMRAGLGVDVATELPLEELLH